MSIDRTPEQLRELRTRFDRASRAAKLELLRGTLETDAASVSQITHLHETLLFMVAYPDDALVRAAAERASRHIGALARKLARTPAGRRSAALRESGILHTTARVPASLDAAVWLSERFPRHAALAWGDGFADRLEALLPRLVAPCEHDGLMDQSLTTREWLDRARGRTSELAWLVGRFRQLDAAPAVRDALWEELDPRIEWRLDDPGAARTTARFPVGRIHPQRRALERGADVAAVLARPIPVVRPLSPRVAQHWIDIARAALLVRGRETDPVTWANPREVLHVPLERGIDLAVIGMRPGRRLPIESFFGYVAAKNGVPAAYGGGWVFFERCEIGVNVFDSFRGGESAFLFAQILRAYKFLFHVKHFTVDPFQFGAANREGIQSGAFWFYHRLGFRPVDAELHALADAEGAKLQADRGYRTPPATLRKLATAMLELVVEPASDRVPDLARLSGAASRWIGLEFAGDAAAAREAAVRMLLGARGQQGSQRRPRDQEVAFESLAPLAAMIPDVAKWPAAQRKAVVNAFRLKGGSCERDYALALQRLPRLREAWNRLAGGC
jgi:hypothetical protein